MTKGIFLSERIGFTARGAYCAAGAIILVLVLNFLVFQLPMRAAQTQWQLCSGNNYMQLHCRVEAMSYIELVTTLFCWVAAVIVGMAVLLADRGCIAQRRSVERRIDFAVSIALILLAVGLSVFGWLAPHM